MFVLDTGLFKDPITEPLYFGTLNQIGGYATKNTREDTCCFLSQSKFSRFALFLHPIMFCKQLHNGDSHWGWKGSLKSSSPTLLLKRGQLAQGAQVNHIQPGLQYHHRDFITCPVSPFQWVLLVRWNFVWFCLCPLSLLLSLGTTERSLASSYSFLSIRYIQTWIKIPLSLQTLPLLKQNSSPTFLVVTCLISTFQLSLSNNSYWPYHLSELLKPILTHSAPQYWKVSTVALQYYITVFQSTFFKVILSHQNWTKPPKL